MKVYESKEIRNVGIVGHGHSGKTSLVAGLFYTSGAVNRLTRVDEGNTRRITMTRKSSAS